MPSVPTDMAPRSMILHDEWTPLDRPATRYLARRCIAKGQPVVEVAEILGMCAEELAAMLNIGEGR